MWRLMLICFLTNCITCIFTPYEGGQKKPALTPGIKGGNWKSPAFQEVQVHHNYSHVNYQNPKLGNALTPDQIQESTTKKIYPIYRPNLVQGTEHVSRNEPTQKVIVRVKKQLEVYDKCPPGATGQFVYTLSCNQFLNCWKGRTFILNCAPGTLFNPDTLTCDFPEKVKCITGPRQTMYEGPPASLSHNLNTRQVQPNCPSDFSGRIPNYSNCSKFVVCTSGESMNQNCPPGTLFDINRNICDFPKIAKCFNGQNQDVQDQTVDYFVVDSSNKIQQQVPVNYKPITPGIYSTQYGGSTPQRSNCGTTACRTIETTQTTHDCFPPTCSGVANSGSRGRQTVPNCNPNESGCRRNEYGNQDQSPDSSNFHETYYQTGIDNNNFEQTSETSNNRSPKVNNGVDDPGHPFEDFSNIRSNQGRCNPQISNCQGQKPNQSSNPQYPPSRGGDLNQNQVVQCPYGSSGLQPHPFDCNKFLNCANGMTFVQNCGPGTVFNPNMMICDFPQNVNCGGKNVVDINDNSLSSTQGNDDYDDMTTSFAYLTPGYSKPTTFRGHYITKPPKTHGNIPNQPNYPNYHNTDFNNPPGFATGKPAYPITPKGYVPRYEPSSTNGYISGQPNYPNYDETGFNNQPSFTTRKGASPTIPKGYIPSYEPQFTNENIPGQPNYPSYGDSSHIRPSGFATKRPQSPYSPDYSTRRPNYSINQDYDDIGSYKPQGFATRRPMYPSKPQGLDHDYDDIGASRPFVGNKKSIYPSQNTENDLKRETIQENPQKNKTWPPPFPATDTNADYVFEYYKVDLEADLEPENQAQTLEIDCKRGGFDCSNSQKKCIAKNFVCDGNTDCLNGSDEQGCIKHLDKFEVKKNTRLAVQEKERWDNTSVTSCAYLCLESKKFPCRSFNYRNVDNCCLLSDMNEGLTGRLMALNYNDFYELSSSKVDCKNKFRCNSNKCIDKDKLCDGLDDCGDRGDEKNCPAEAIGFKVSLEGSKNPWEGRVQVQAFGRIGYVCDDNFDIRDANVVCKELGYNLGAAEVKGNSFFAQDVPLEKVFYVMDDVMCEGNETSIKDCDFNGWGSHDCTNQEVVGVICKAEQEKCPDMFWKCKNSNECVPMAFVCDGPEDCTDGSDETDDLCNVPSALRLVNGTSSSEGRIEIKYHGVWGTVCDDDFNDDAAKVVCRNLGFKGTVVVKKEGYFGEGVGPIWLDQVTCFGNESRLDKCGHWNWGEHNCDHSEDVGVICSNTNTEDVERHIKKPQRIESPAINPDVTYPIYPTSCGLRKNSLLTSDGGVHFRVVQGSRAKPGDYPWQAAIRVKGKIHLAHWCGAVVISSKFVLTAAHCLVGYPKGAYIVVAGDYNVQEDEETEQSAYIDDYFIHEDFRKGHKMNNDIALVKLKGIGFKLNQDVQAICLPDSDTNYDVNLNCSISGFGSIESGTSAFSNELRAGSVPLQRQSVCRMPHVYGPNLTEGMICAGTLDGGTDSCDGDSGGPLACLDEGLYTLYGITSWGQRCGYANKPGVYVKVAHYKNWIDEKLQKNS